MLRQLHCMVWWVAYVHRTVQLEVWLAQFSSLLLLLPAQAYDQWETNEPLSIKQNSHLALHTCNNTTC
jgi:hypothetical protein